MLSQHRIAGVLCMPRYEFVSCGVPHQPLRTSEVESGETEQLLPHSSEPLYRPALLRPKYKCLGISLQCEAASGQFFLEPFGANINVLDLPGRLPAFGVLRWERNHEHLSSLTIDVDPYRLELHVLQLDAQHLIRSQPQVKRCISPPAHLVAFRSRSLFRRIPDFAMDNLATDAGRDSELSCLRTLTFPSVDSVTNLFNLLPRQRLAVRFMLR